MNRKEEQDDAVSPVIGVILMVAVTVILAATIGTFVLDLGENVENNARAGISAEADDAVNNITVSVVTLDNSDYVLLRGANGLGVYNSPASGVTDGDAVGSDSVYLNRTGTNLRLGGTGSGRVTIVAVVGAPPEGSVENGGLTSKNPPDGTTQTTVQEVEYDFD